MVLALFFLWGSYFKQGWRGGGWQNSKQWKLYFPRYLKCIEWSQLTFVFDYFLDQVLPLRTNTMGGTPKGPISKELVASVQFFCLSLYITASPLHKNLQVVNYERCKCSSGYSKETQTCAIHVRHVWNCSLPSTSYCWRSFSSRISHLFSLLGSVTLLARSLDASPWMPAVVLHHCTFSRYSTVRLKMFSLLSVLVFMHYLYEKYYSINLLLYRTIYLIVLVG